MRLIPDIPLSLDEAAAWLELKGVKGLTSRDLLRAGAYGKLRICLPLTCEARTMRRGITALLHGVYKLRQKTLLEIEAKGKGKADCAYDSDDEVFFIDPVDVTLDELRIEPHVLESYRDVYAPAAKGETVLVTSQSGDDWRVQARMIADECFDHDTKMNCRDSLAHKNSAGHIIGGYCFRVMTLMQERDIKGARGIIDNPATIMREALQGKKWWANKSK